MDINKNVKSCLTGSQISGLTSLCSQSGVNCFELKSICFGELPEIGSIGVLYVSGVNFQLYFWCYTDQKFIKLSTPDNIVIAFTDSELPHEGKENVTYISVENKRLMLWDTEYNIYKTIVGNNSSDISYVRSGFSNRYGENVDFGTVKDALDYILQF
jgi:hypothetical protein